MWGGGDNLRYALIGLCPYSFHYELGRILRYRALFLPYFTAFNDLHNFPISADVYKDFFREDYLAKEVPAEPLNVNNPYIRPTSKILPEKSITAKLNTWNKQYPETRDENIKILDDYLTLCEENNIRPIMFLAPNSENYMGSFNKEILEEFRDLVGQACQKHTAACFIDGYKLNLLTYADFFDNGHMNIHGAAKFSSYLNDFIEKLEAQGG